MILKVRKAARHHLLSGSNVASELANFFSVFTSIVCGSVNGSVDLFPS
jgi:hypothetical protein